MGSTTKFQHDIVAFIMPESVLMVYLTRIQTLTYTNYRFVCHKWFFLSNAYFPQLLYLTNLHNYISKSLLKFRHRVHANKIKIVILRLFGEQYSSCIKNTRDTTHYVDKMIEDENSQLKLIYIFTVLKILTIIDTHICVFLPVNMELV